jgi:hypothetical protein
VSSLIQPRAGCLDLEEAVLLPEREEMQLLTMNFTFNIDIKTVVASPVMVSNNLNISVLSSGAQNIVSTTIQTITVKV